MYSENEIVTSWQWNNYCKNGGPGTHFEETEGAQGPTHQVQSTVQYCLFI